MFIFGKIWRMLLIIAMIVLVIAGIVFAFKGEWLITILCVPAIAICKRLWSKSEEKHLLQEQMMMEYLAEEINKPTMTGALLRRNRRDAENFELRQIANDLSSINNKLH